MVKKKKKKKKKKELFNTIKKKKIVTAIKKSLYLFCNLILIIKQIGATNIITPL